MIRVTAALVGADVAVEEPKPHVFDDAVGILHVGATTTNGLDFGSGQSHPGFKFFQQEVVMGSDPIDGGVTLATGCGITARAFLCVGFGLVRGLAGHNSREWLS